MAHLSKRSDHLVGPGALHATVNTFSFSRVMRLERLRPTSRRQRWRAWRSRKLKGEQDMGFALGPFSAKGCSDLNFLPTNGFSKLNHYKLVTVSRGAESNRFYIGAFFSVGTIDFVVTGIPPRERTTLCGPFRFALFWLVSLKHHRKKGTVSPLHIHTGEVSSRDSPCGAR